MKKKPSNKPLIGRAIIIGLSLLGGLVSILPVLIGGPRTSFFTFEPDAVYVTNAILYNDTGKIYYIDHPATPSIVTLSKVILPLKHFFSLSQPSEFIYWSIVNQGYFYLYLRVFYSLIFTLALSIFLALIYRATHSSLAIIFSWLALFSYRHFPSLGVSIASETVSFFLLSIWFSCLYIFLKTRNKIPLFATALLSGLSVANKFTNMAFAVVPPVLTILMYSLPVGLPFSIVVGIFILLGFIYGISPILQDYNSIISWALKLATRSGAHGDGSVDLINISTHISSIKTLWHNESFAITFIILISLILVFFNFKDKLRDKITFPLLILACIVFGFILAFTKHSLSRYQQTNYFAFAFIASLLFPRFNRILKSLFIIFVLFASSSVISSYLTHTSLAVDQANSLENFIANHPPQKAVIWEYGYSIDYALLTSQEWYGDLYADQLKKVKPNLYAITSDLKKIKTSLDETQDLFTFCWDKLYMQKEILPRFLDLYPNKIINIIQIPNTSLRPMVLIESDHCLSKAHAKL